MNRLHAEEQQRKKAGHFGIVEAMFKPRVLALAFVYFGCALSNYGVGFFLPQIVKGFGLSNAATGFVTAIPYVVGTVGMIWFSRRSDRKRERRGHEAVALTIAAGGIALSTAFDNPTLKMLCLSISAFGVFSSLPVFWTLPTAFLSGASAAAGIAVINSIGNLSGFVGPYAMGWIRDRTGTYTLGLLLVSVVVFTAMITVLLLGHDSRLERPPETGDPAEQDAKRATA
jgi:cyanate permease